MAPVGGAERGEVKARNYLARSLELVRGGWSTFAR